MTSSRLEMLPDQNAFQIWSIWLLMAPVIMKSPSCLQPVFNRLGQALFQRDAVVSHQQRALRLEGIREGAKAWKRTRRAAALHCDCDDRAAGPHHDIQLAVPSAPVE